jgi:uncharacterized protein YukE
MPGFVVSEPTANLEYPRDVFKMQNNVSDNLNKFQIRYGRYLRCQNSETADEVTDPPCDLNTIDSFSELSVAYKQLYNSLDEIKTVYSKQSTFGGVTNEAYDENLKEIKKKYKKVTVMQNTLDQQLKFIQDQLEDTNNSSEQLLNTRKFLNMVLIIIAICILYYVIVEL